MELVPHSIPHPPFGHPLPSLGFFDVELRVPWLLAKGNPLSRLEAVLDWELFRPLLDAALDKPAKGPGGRPTTA